MIFVLLSKNVCVLSCFSHVWLCATLWTVAFQAPLSVGFSRQEYWSGLPCPPPGDLPNPGTETMSLMSAALAGTSSWPLVPPGKPLLCLGHCTCHRKWVCGQGLRSSFIKGSVMFLGRDPRSCPLINVTLTQPSSLQTTCSWRWSSRGRGDGDQLPAFRQVLKMHTAALSKEKENVWISRSFLFSDPAPLACQLTQISGLSSLMEVTLWGLKPQVDLWFPAGLVHLTQVRASVHMKFWKTI